MYPTNEAETIELFRLAQDRLGWKLVTLQRYFPDAVVLDPEGQQKQAEFEYQASNFFRHGHDPAGCDVVICWANDWPACPLPVYALVDNLPPLDPLWSAWAKRRDVPEDAPGGKIDPVTLILEAREEVTGREIAHTATMRRVYAQVAMTWHSLAEWSDGDDNQAHILSKTAELGSDLVAAWKKIALLQVLLAGFLEYIEQKQLTL